MAFRFSLETVLRLRRSLEEAERLRLQRLHVDRRHLDELTSETSKAQGAITAALYSAIGKEAPLLGAELRFAAQRLHACILERERLVSAAAILEHQIARQQNVLLQRQVQRKVMDELREQQRSLYERNTNRRAQTAIEEILLLRRAHSGRVGGTME